MIEVRRILQTVLWDVPRTLGFCIRISSTWETVYLRDDEFFSADTVCIIRNFVPYKSILTKLNLFVIAILSHKATAWTLLLQKLLFTISPSMITFSSMIDFNFYLKI